MSTACVVLAKAPVPGRVKTRLGAVVGAHRAAHLAAAALVDTLAACAAAFGPGARYLALDGDLTDAVDRTAIEDALAGWSRFPQPVGNLGERIAHAHRAVHRDGHRVVVQVGMDTPHLTADQLRRVVHLAGDGQPVLGAANDGGWWVLATTAPAQVDGLAAVAMSTSRTHEQTRALLAGKGFRPRRAPVLRDVDEVSDAEAVAGLAPGTRFARVWAS